MRERADYVGRQLDLEDGSAVITCKLGSVEFTWTVEDGVDRSSYQLIFHETQTLSRFLCGVAQARVSSLWRGLVPDQGE